MTDKKVLTDGNHVIELYRLQGSYHNDGLIVAYLPKEKILVEADAFTPPAQADAPPPNPITANNANLMENIGRLKLDVETIVPIHYPPTPQGHDGGTAKGSRQRELVRLTRNCTLFISEQFFATASRTIESVKKA